MHLRQPAGTDIVDVNIVDIFDVSCLLNIGRHSWLTMPASTFNCTSSLVTLFEAPYSWRMAIIISVDVRNTHPAVSIQSVQDRSCSDKRRMNNKAITLKLLVLYMHTYKLHVKWFNSLPHWFVGTPSAKHSLSRMRSWWLPLSIKTRVLGIHKGRVSFPADLTC